MIQKRFRIGILGHYGQNNLGDEATILAVLQNLKERMPDLEMIGLSLNPFDTTRRYDIESFPIRFDQNFFQKGLPVEVERRSFVNNPTPNGLKTSIKEILPDKVNNSTAVTGFLHLARNMKSEIQFLRKVREQLKDLDAIMICGSGQLEDFEGPWGYPYTLLKWTLLAKSTNTHVFIVSIGAGPPSHSSSYWMLDKTLKQAEYLSFRDQWSKEVIEVRIPGINGLVYPDLAHGLKVTPLSKNGTGKNRTVAINPMPVFDSNLMHTGKAERYENYLNHLLTFINHVLDKGYIVKLFNTHTSDLQVINHLLDRLYQTAEPKDSDIQVIEHKTVRELMQTLSEADIVIGTRFHSTVLPLILNKPVIGICYHKKSSELLEDVGLKDFFVELNEFTGQELIMKFDRLCLNIQAIQKELEFHHKRYTQLLDKQWDYLVDMLQSLNSNKACKRRR